MSRKNKFKHLSSPCFDIKKKMNKGINIIHDGNSSERLKQRKIL